MVPARPSISRLPSTEKTTAGSVGDNAAPINIAVVQPNPNSRWAVTANAAAVTAVPATPIQITAPAEVRNRFQPMCMPPSKSTKMSATVTMRSLRCGDSVPSSGNRSEAMAAATRKTAGAGTRIRSLIRLASTANKIATAINPISQANGRASFIGCSVRWRWTWPNSP